MRRRARHANKRSAFAPAARPLAASAARAAQRRTLLDRSQGDCFRLFVARQLSARTAQQPAQPSPHSSTGAVALQVHRRRPHRLSRNRPAARAPAPSACRPAPAAAQAPAGQAAPASSPPRKHLRLRRHGARVASGSFARRPRRRFLQAAAARSGCAEPARAGSRRAASRRRFRLPAHRHPGRRFDPAGARSQARPQALSLRYQATFVRAARECRVKGKDVNIKVGVQGRIILGPAGGPGELTVPLRYALV